MNLSEILINTCIFHLVFPYVLNGSSTEYLFSENSIESENFSITCLSFISISNSVGNIGKSCDFFDKSNIYTPLESLEALVSKKSCLQFFLVLVAMVTGPKVVTYQFRQYSSYYIPLKRKF